MPRIAQHCRNSQAGRSHTCGRLGEQAVQFCALACASRLVEGAERLPHATAESILERAVVVLETGRNCCGQICAHDTAMQELRDYARTLLWTRRAAALRPTPPARLRPAGFYLRAIQGTPRPPSKHS